MRTTKILPRLQIFVCANRREGSPLGPGCGDFGDALYDALKATVAARGEVQGTWVTKTHCLGICPKRGATVARYVTSDTEPRPWPIVTEAEAGDATTLLDGPSEPSTIGAFAAELDALETLQNEKVLALAKRLRPGLTSEDVQNPHDFPELADPDWQYADGLRAGIGSVRSALLALLAQRS